VKKPQPTMESNISFGFGEKPAKIAKQKYINYHLATRQQLV
jgi:hypothetical protein